MENYAHRPFYAALIGEDNWSDRFWSKVSRCGPDDCWHWTAGTASKGYGRFKIGRSDVAASRVAWAIANQRDPGDLIVRHKCDNPPCCNPAHLELGTHADNAQDKVKRGRARTGRQDGERNGHATLTIEQVGKIVEAFRAGLNNQQIAYRFPVGHSLVSRIRTGRSWRREAEAFGWKPQRLAGHSAPMAGSYYRAEITRLAMGEGA
jgi:hypothetical protein